MNSRKCIKSIDGQNKCIQVYYDIAEIIAMLIKFALFILLKYTSKLNLNSHLYKAAAFVDLSSEF